MQSRTWPLTLATSKSSLWNSESSHDGCVFLAVSEFWSFFDLLAFWWDLFCIGLFAHGFILFLVDFGSHLEGRTPRNCFFSGALVVCNCFAISGTLLLLMGRGWWSIGYPLYDMVCVFVWQLLSFCISLLYHYRQNTCIWVETDLFCHVSFFLCIEWELLLLFNV